MSNSPTAPTSEEPGSSDSPIRGRGTSHRGRGRDSGRGHGRGRGRGRGRGLGLGNISIYRQYRETRSTQ